MHFVSLAWKNLRQRPSRTLLTLMALASAIASVVALLGIARGFQNSFADVYRGHAVDVVVSRQGAADRLSSSMDQELGRQVAKLPEIQRSAVVLLETLSLEEQGIYGIPSLGLNPTSWMFDNFEFKKPLPDADARAGDSSKRLWLGVHLAERLAVQTGASLDLFGESFVVAGVFTSKSTWENGSMILPLEQLQALTGREGQVTYVNVVLGTEADRETVDDVVVKIQQLDPRLLALPTEQFVATDTRMQIASAMAWMTSMIAIVIGAIGTLNTMMTSVLERTGEIGILRAIGWSRRRIVAMILGESVLLAILATLLGCVGAWCLIKLLGQSPAVRGVLDASVDPVAMTQGVLVGVTIGLVGAVIPAWRASRLSPTEAFRQR